jgi:hypothetical protein
MREDDEMAGTKNGHDREGDGSNDRSEHEV